MEGTILSEIISKPYKVFLPPRDRELLIRSRKITILESPYGVQKKSDKLIVLGEDWVFDPGLVTGLSMDVEALTLSWSALSGVSGYDVYLSSDAGDTYAKQNVSTVTGTEYIWESLADGDYLAYVVPVLGAQIGDASSTVSFAVQNTFSFMFLVDTNSQVWVVSVADGSTLFGPYTGLFDGSRNVISVDWTNGFLYTVGTAEDIRQYPFNLATGEITTTANWENNTALNFSVSHMFVTGDGSLIVCGYFVGGSASGAQSLGKFNKDTGALQWDIASSVAYSLHGAAPSPSGIVVGNGFSDTNFKIIRESDGVLLGTYPLKTVGGSNVTSGRITWVGPATETHVFISVTGTSTFSGVYKVNLSTQATDAFFNIASSSGAGTLMISEDYVFVGRSSSTGGALDGGNYLLNISDLTQVLSGIPAEGGDLGAGTRNQEYMGMLSTGNFAFVDKAALSTVRVKDATDTEVWNKVLPVSCFLIEAAFQRGYPFL